MKINLFKNEHKVSLKYCQITKRYFKYFKSIYSSSVWMDKPLMRLPIKNIGKLVIGSNSIQKLKNTNHINYLLQIFIKFTDDFPFNNLYELKYIRTDENKEPECILEFGLEDEETAMSIVQILSFLRNLISKKLI